MSDDAAGTIADHFITAGLEKDRFVSVKDGAKMCVNHDSRWSDPRDVPGQNYGIYANEGDQLVILDVDYHREGGDDISPVSLAALGGLPLTLKVQSPHVPDDDRGGHRILKLEGDETPAELFEREFGKKNPVPSWGEVVSKNKYVVGPGSQLNDCDKEWCDDCAEGDGGWYTIKKDRPIATVDPETLVEALAVDPDLTRKGQNQTLEDTIDARQHSREDVGAPDSGDDNDTDAPKREYTREEVESMLEKLPGNQHYDDWIRTGFAVYDWDNGETGKEVFEQWSRTNSKWAPESQYKIDKIWQDGESGQINGNASVGTLVYLAKENGWVDPKSTSAPADVETDSSDIASSYSGPIVKTERGYAKRVPAEDGGTELKSLTNFHIDVVSRLRYPDDDTREFQLEVCPTSENDSAYTVEADPTAFNELRSFKNTVLRGFSTRFDGGQKDLNELREYIAAKEAPTRTGTKDLGLHDEVVVTPDGVIAPDGWVDDPEYVYTEDDMGINQNWTLTPDAVEDVDEDAVREALEQFPQHRDPERLLPALGWFYTAGVSPYIRDWEGEFNILNVTGDTGAGKSSTIELLWQMFGIGEEGVKVEGTTFPMMRNLSSGDLPVFFDEYKPSDMADYKVNAFHNYLRTATRGGYEQRGNADKSVESYHLRTPAVVVGEQPIQGPAEERRTILTSFKREARDNTDYARAFYQIDGGSVGGEMYEGVDLENHALAYYQWITSVEEETFKAWWSDARKFVLEVLDRLSLEGLDDIVVQGYVTVAFGTRLYKKFAAEYGADVERAGVTDEQLAKSIEYLTTEGSGAEHRSHLERFLNVMGRAIADDALELDEHYTFVHKGKPNEQLCIKMETAFDKVRKYAREHDVAGEDLFSNLGDYDGRIRDAANKDGTPVLKTSKKARPIGRSVAFDPDAILLTRDASDEDEGSADDSPTVTNLEPGMYKERVTVTVAEKLDAPDWLDGKGYLADEDGNPVPYEITGGADPLARFDEGDELVLQNFKVESRDGVETVILSGITDTSPSSINARADLYNQAATDGGEEVGETEGKDESKPTYGELKEHAQLFVANAKECVVDEGEVHNELMDEYGISLDKAKKAARQSRLTYREQPEVYEL